MSNLDEQHEAVQVGVALSTMVKHILNELYTTDAQGGCARGQRAT